MVEPDYPQASSVKYRRAFVPGATYFFTVVTAHRRPILATNDAVTVLRDAFRCVRRTRPFELHAAVVLPDHLHCVWTLPPDDDDFATRWRLIKTWFTKHCNPTLRGHAGAACQASRPRMVWQQRYWEHLIRDDDDLIRHVEYIHFNPVKHRLAMTPSQWPFSSFRRYVVDGRYPLDWGSSAMEFGDAGNE